MSEKKTLNVPHYSQPETLGEGLEIIGGKTQVKIGHVQFGAAVSVAGGVAPQRWLLGDNFVASLLEKIIFLGKGNTIEESIEKVRDDLKTMRDLQEQVYDFYKKGKLSESEIKTLGEKRIKLYKLKRKLHGIDEERILRILILRMHVETENRIMCAMAPDMHNAAMSLVFGISKQPATVTLTAKERGGIGKVDSDLFAGQDGDGKQAGSQWGEI